MAAPNLVNVTSIFGKTAGAALDTSSADIVTNSAASGKVFKINTIICANVDGTNNADLTVSVFDASANVTYSLASTMTVPADASIDILGKSIYLEEGDKITGLASAAGDLQLVVSYEEID
jgi:hypothetical protein